MRRLLSTITITCTFGFVITLLSIATTGCNSRPASTKGTPSTGNTKTGRMPTLADEEPDMELVMRVRASLPAEDRAAVEKQDVCLVSGQVLGSMGAPVKIELQGTPVWLCSEKCKEQLLRQPDDYLAKVKQK